MAKQQPGVMLYFEVRQCLKRLTLEEKGALFEAILDYGEHGIVPAFDGVLGVAWDFVCLRIDKDSQRYEDVSRRRAAAARARWEKEQGMQMHANDANADFAMQTMPTTTTTTTPTTTTTTTTTPIRAAEAGDCPEDPVVVVSAYRERVDQAPPQPVLDKLARYAQEMGAECCIKAMDIALEAKAASWPYIEGILSIKLSQGVRSLADWEAVEERRRGQWRPAGRRDGPPGGGARGGDDLGGIRASMAWMDSFLAEQLGASPGEERPPDTRAPPE